MVEAKAILTVLAAERAVTGNKAREVTFLDGRQGKNERGNGGSLAASNEGFGPRSLERLCTSQ